MTPLIQSIYDRHDVYCNQKYGDFLPYSFHLKAVVAQAEKYQEQCKLHYIEILDIAAAGHDLIEDARMTYNDVFDLINDAHGYTYANTVANIIYACTECRGRSRTERHSQEYFNTLKENRAAVFVKLCDIIANVTYSLLMNSSMYKKYKKEYIILYQQLYKEGEYEDMWYDLRKLLDYA